MDQSISRVYIHYPFCLKLCHYCNFAAGVASTSEFIDAYHKALIREIEHYKQKYDFKNIAEKSLYIGGGTPSLMPNDKLEELFNLIPTNQNTEITLEINPETVTKEKALFWKSLGINRVSLGWQSMDLKTLKFLGRSGTPIDNLEAFEILRNSNFENISVDKILSVKGDCDKEFFNALKTHTPDHISTYQLSIEKKTVLDYWTKIKKYTPVSDSKALNIECETEEILSGLGFTRYEISNYHKNNKIGNHNMGYWNYEFWLGLGASACGFLPNNHFGFHYKNKFSFKEYCQQPLDYEEKEDISFNTAIKEALMLGIRKRSGIIKKSFEEKFNISWNELFIKHCNTDYFSEDEFSVILKHEAIFLANPAILSLWDNINKNFELIK